MSKESYARGFAKAAEAAGVDPEKLIKLAANPLSLASALRVLYKGAPGMSMASRNMRGSAVLALQRALGRAKAGSKGYPAFLRKVEDMLSSGKMSKMTNLDMIAAKDPVAAGNYRAIEAINKARRDIMRGEYPSSALDWTLMDKTDIPYGDISEIVDRADNWARFFQ